MSKRSDDVPMIWRMAAATGWIVLGALAMIVLLAVLGGP